MVYQNENKLLKSCCWMINLKHGMFEKAIEETKSHYATDLRENIFSSKNGGHYL